MEKYDEIDKIDQRLFELDVKELTPEEVQERYINALGISPYVEKPVASNVTWLSSTTEYTYSGKTYVVQTLTAQPNTKESCLKISGSRAISSTYKWKAGLMNPNVIQGKWTLNSTPSGYNSTVNAVKAYVDLGVTQRAWVTSVKITGLESKTVSNIYPSCPEFPAQIS